MDRVIAIASYQWLAYWRRFARGGKLTVGNQGLTLIVGGLVLFKYAQNLRLAAVELAQGRTELLETLLGGICFAWLLAFASREQKNAGLRRWLHLPLTLKELFAIRVISLLMPPYLWVVFAGSLAICYATAYAARPVTGTIAALLFIVFSGLMGFTIAHLLSIAWWRKALGATALALAAMIGLYVLENPGTMEPLGLSALLPMRLVARAATARQTSVAFTMLAILSGLALIAFAAALLSFRQTLEQSSTSNSARSAGWRFSIPGRLGGLIAKDFRYFRRLLDIYLGLLAVAAGCFYLVTVEAVSLDICLIFLTILFLPNSPLVFDCFGLDSGSGLDRYTLLPLSGQTIILSKNLAFLGFVGMQALPLLLLITLRLALSEALLGFMTVVSLACAYMAWGNWMSVSHPVKMHFFRFSARTASIFDAMAGIAFSSSPGVLIIYLLHSPRHSIWTIALVPLFYGALYFLSLIRSGKRFSQKRETIARALA